MPRKDCCSLMCSACIRGIFVGWFRTLAIGSENKPIVKQVGVLDTMCGSVIRIIQA
jgi:hypothetical protein